MCTKNAINKVKANTVLTQASKVTEYDIPTRLNLAWHFVSRGSAAGVDAITPAYYCDFIIFQFMIIVRTYRVEKTGDMAYKSEMRCLIS